MDEMYIRDSYLLPFVYMWFPVSMLLLFRPYQLIGVKMKLALAAFSVYCLDTLYRVGLQAFEVFTVQGIHITETSAQLSVSS